MKYECYFCHTDISNALIFTASKGSKLYDCLYCVDNYKLSRVLTVWDDDDTLLYGHIYVSIRGADYHIRLHLKKNYTHIGQPSYNIFGPRHIMDLPGHPLTPANIKEKLKLYLLFS